LGPSRRGARGSAASGAAGGVGKLRVSQDIRAAGRKYGAPPRRTDAPRCAPAQVALLTVMVGNLALKSLARAAIFTAT